MKIYYIRHCKTENNIKKRWQGITDIDLSEEGLMELEQLKKETKNYNFDIVFSSPLKRAIRTAEIFKKEKTKLIIENSIIERNFGLLELQEIKKEQTEILSNLKLNSDLNMNVEKINDMYNKRIKPFLMKIKKEFENTNKNILICSHSWVGRLLFYFVSNEKDEQVIKIAPKHASIYEIKI